MSGKVAVGSLNNFSKLYMCVYIYVYKCIVLFLGKEAHFDPIHDSNYYSWSEFHFLKL